MMDMRVDMLYTEEVSVGFRVGVRLLKATMILWEAWTKTLGMEGTFQDLKLMIPVGFCLASFRRRVKHSVVCFVHKYGWFDILLPQ